MSRITDGTSDDPLVAYGWDDDWARELETHREAGLLPGRVVLERRRVYSLQTRDGELDARVAGRLRHAARGPDELPAIGDWVGFKPQRGGPARIHVVLPRRSRFSRKVAGARTHEQVVAANVDRIFLVTGLDGDFSLRRIERYLIAAGESGAEPVVVLNKADLAADAEAVRREVEGIAPSVPVVLTCGRKAGGAEPLRRFLEAGKAVALVGSSGVGKSTLTNLLYGAELMRTAEVRGRDDRGQHTTSHRQLVRLDCGALLIDNPGIRELQLWAGDEGLSAAFAEVEELAASCRFRDCGHGNEPGCAVQAAIAEGSLDRNRLEAYRAAQSELEGLERRQRGARALQEKARPRGAPAAPGHDSPGGD